MLKRSIRRTGSALILAFILLIAPAVKENHSEQSRAVCAESSKCMPETGRMLNRLSRFPGNIFSAALEE